jgi:hypothetical protein
MLPFARVLLQMGAEVRAALSTSAWLALGKEGGRWSRRSALRSLRTCVALAIRDCSGCAAAAQVLLYANSGPTINDVTAPELAELLPQAAAADPAVLGAAVSGGRLRVVASGSDLPVIDLTQVG